ncbi:TAXI family TRAP transporter solute-binding subunit, partial [Chloroflexota bacterium]
PRHLVMGVPSATSAHYFIFVGVGEVMKREMGITFVPEATGGATASFNLLSKGEINLGSGAFDVIHYATFGQEGFKDNQIPQMRVVAPYMPFMIGWFTQADSGIKTFADLKGKRLAGNATRSPIVKAINLASVHAAGLTEDDLAAFLPLHGQKEAAGYIKDRTADCAAWAANPGFAGASWAEMANSLNVRQLSMTEEMQKAVIEEYVWGVPQLQKAGIYKDVDYDVRGVGWDQTFVAELKIPADLVYTMMMIMYDDQFKDEFSALHPATVQFTLERAINDKPPAPYHPGAIKYFKDRGVWTAEVDAANKKLLSELGMAE